MKQATNKVPNGKMIKVNIKGEKQIQEIKIHGDFFLEPPETRKNLENQIKGLKTTVTTEEIQSQIETVQGKLIGFNKKQLAETIKQALENKQNGEK